MVGCAQPLHPSQAHTNCSSELPVAFAHMERTSKMACRRHANDTQMESMAKAQTSKDLAPPPAKNCNTVAPSEPSVSTDRDGGWCCAGTAAFVLLVTSVIVTAFCSTYKLEVEREHNGVRSQTRLQKE